MKKIHGNFNIENSLYRKARKRDRECIGSENERKLYLQDPLLELRIPENEINFLTDLPGGLDYNEWLASHSESINTKMSSFPACSNVFHFQPLDSLNISI